MGCDLVGFSLMQRTPLGATGTESIFSPQSPLALTWDFASVCLWLTLRHHILHLMSLVGLPISDMHPPPNVRLNLLESVFPAWSQEFGKRLSNMLRYRITKLFL
jgi:hypothetical protein